MSGGLRVAFVKPVFSATAYSHHFGGPPSFYEFYNKAKNVPMTENITSPTDLALLNVSVVDGWGWSQDFHRYVTSIMGDYGVGLLGAESFTILSDINVTQGEIFNDDGSNRFDVILLGFTEYVTLQEYDAYWHFVASGGRIVFMDASNFVAEVRYYSQSNHMALVRGHGWGFDGNKAWHDAKHFQRWEVNNTNWVGSNELSSATLTFSSSCDESGVPRQYNGANVTGDYQISVALRERFGSTVFQCYMGHEENSVTNVTKTTILARWLPSDANVVVMSNVVAAYLHRYVNGTVVYIGVMSSDIAASDRSVQFFLLSAIRDSTA